VKRTLALILGLAAVLLFAPVARADFHGGKSPYRDAAALLGPNSDIKPADGDHDGGDDHDGDANDGSHHDDGSGASDGQDDHDDNETSCEGPTTQSVPSNASLWLWVLLVVIAGAAVSTVYVLRRRRMRAR